MNISIGNNINRKATFFYKWIMRAIKRNEPLRVFGPTRDSGNHCIEAAYVINLTRQSTRWKSFVREARRQKVESQQSLLDFCIRISATDGKLLRPPEASSQVAVTYPLEAQYYVDPDPRLLTKIKEGTVNINMTREEMAVALSHIKTWQRIVADKTSYALILEDDVFFERSFSNQLNQSWQELPKKRNDGYKFDLFYLSYREVDHGAQRVYLSPNLVQPIRGYWWLSGYVLSYSGANKLLQSLPVIGPVDMWMNHLYSELDVYSTPKSVISQRTDLQSDNRYSILPLLSQLGVQTDKSHLLLEQKKGRSPVFGIGFDRKEYNQLEEALSLLGYRCCNDKWENLSDKIVNIINNNLPLLFDAYLDIRNIGRYFEQLDNLYPNAVFIIPSTPLETNDLSLQKYKEISTYFADHNKKLLKVSITRILRFLISKRKAFEGKTIVSG